MYTEWGVIQGCDSKGQGGTALPPASVCFHQPLLQGIGSSKEGLAARKATSWASPSMQLVGGLLQESNTGQWGKEKNKESIPQQRASKKLGRTDCLSGFRKDGGKVKGPWLRSSYQG